LLDLKRGYAAPSSGRALAPLATPIGRPQDLVGDDADGDDACDCGDSRTVALGELRARPTERRELTSDLAGPRAEFLCGVAGSRP